MKYPFDIYITSREGDNPRRPTVLAEVSRVFGADTPRTIIDGPDATAGDFREHCLPVLPEDRHKLLPGYLACGTVHVKALAAFLRTKAQTALIVEDDVKFIVDAGRLMATLRELPRTFDWCLLANTKWKGGAKFERGTPGRFVKRSFDTSWGSFAYFVSRKGATTLISEMIPQYTTYDCVTKFKAKDNEVYNVVESMATITGAPSLILLPGWEDLLKNNE